jgi:hypothetical protein
MHLETFDEIGIQNSGSCHLVPIGRGHWFCFYGFGLGSGQFAPKFLRLLALNGVESSVAFFAQADQIV